MQQQQQQQPLPDSQDLRPLLKRLLLLQSPSHQHQHQHPDKPNHDHNVPLASSLAASILHLILAGHASPAQIAAFLTSLRTSGLDHSPSLIAACAHVLRNHATPCPALADTDTTIVCDIVGTGGDGHDTFNVSTTAALVAAGAGCTVAKHGNRASSSSSGSADLLEAAGCHISAIQPHHLPAILHATNGFVFLFAQTYHPAMRHVAPVRRELGVPTLFNVLGPLANPAAPSRAVIGVYHRSLAVLVAESLKLMGVQRALVVCGKEGLDEISPAGETEVWTLDAGNIEYSVVAPELFGIQRVSLADVRGGDKFENAQVLSDLVNNKLPEDHPIVGYVVLNTAALVYVSGVARDFKEGVKMARDSITSGKAKLVLDKFRAATERIVEGKDV
ncbi:glycosyl transferase family, a/b domain-domain-containing protein [Catenaria anguillulae PL171]|uniref:Anthranilate phosphoribosyltransferase n=1 Tax=Catenaria anguillulae PL171 TaxID=765915 RepID=A0A1Y2HIN3_9FUNG|nr:glycosyl transferase family, a/b domain-domain-containing protein [Catenaria anguillulae PL171]